jgi:hypothetical protein
MLRTVTAESLWNKRFLRERKVAVHCDWQLEDIALLIAEVEA